MSFRETAMTYLAILFDSVGPRVESVVKTLKEKYDLTDQDCEELATRVQELSVHVACASSALRELFNLIKHLREKRRLRDAVGIPSEDGSAGESAE